MGSRRRGATAAGQATLVGHVPSERRPGGDHRRNRRGRGLTTWGPAEPGLHSATGSAGSDVPGGFRAPTGAIGGRRGGPFVGRESHRRDPRRRCPVRSREKGIARFVRAHNPEGREGCPAGRRKLSAMSLPPRTRLAFRREARPALLAAEDVAAMTTHTSFGARRVVLRLPGCEEPIGVMRRPACVRGLETPSKGAVPCDPVLLPASK